MGDEAEAMDGWEMSAMGAEFEPDLPRFSAREVQKDTAAVRALVADSAELRHRAGISPVNGYRHASDAQRCMKAARAICAKHGWSNPWLV